MSAYRLEPAHAFFDVTRAIVGYEIRPGNTVTFLSEVDLSEVERVRARRTPKRKPSYTAFVVKALALALREFPYANRRICRRAWLPFAGLQLQQFLTCDVAVACERELPGIEVAAFVDVLRDADRLGLEEIHTWLHALAYSDESNNLQWRTYQRLITRLPCWLAILLIRLPVFFPRLWSRYRGGAALISSPAKYGVDGVVASWTSPLGISFGLVKPRAVVREGRVVARPTFMLTLNFDRRVMAGAQAARFFKRFVDLLEHAETELADLGERRGEVPREEEMAGREDAQAREREARRAKTLEPIAAGS